MNEEAKRVMLDVLREKFINFMNEIIKIPGSPMAKQQAFFKFDEGHMWMQNSIVNYSEEESKIQAAIINAPEAEPAPVEPAPVEQPQVA